MNIKTINLNSTFINTINLKSYSIDKAENVPDKLNILTQWKLVGNSKVIDEQILSCGDLGDDGKYHVLIKADSRVIDIPLDEPLRKVGDVGDTIDLLKDGYDVDLSNPLNGYFMLADGGWNVNSANYGYEIPVVKGCKVIIAANSLKTTYYGFLRNNTHNKADTIGVRNSMNLGEVAEITIDSDECKYLWISCALSTGSSRPQSVVIVSDTTPNTARVTRKIGEFRFIPQKLSLINDYGIANFLFTNTECNCQIVMFDELSKVGLNNRQSELQAVVETEGYHIATSTAFYIRIRKERSSTLQELENLLKDLKYVSVLATPTTSYISVPDIPFAKAYSNENRVPYAEFSYEYPNI